MQVEKRSSERVGVPEATAGGARYRLRPGEEAGGRGSRGEYAAVRTATAGLPMD
jgi:hypothetical protein